MEIEESKLQTSVQCTPTPGTIAVMINFLSIGL